MDGATIEILDAETGRPVGRITSGQMQWLVDQLEEESEDDRDYYIDGPTLDMLQEAGADPALIQTLRSALGSREGMEIRWGKDDRASARCAVRRDSTPSLVWACLTGIVELQRRASCAIGLSVKRLMFGLRHVILHPRLVSGIEQLAE